MLHQRPPKIIEERPAGLIAGTGQPWRGGGGAPGRGTSCRTVEISAGPQREFFFLEVNTRLQVEHPITEITTGSIWSPTLEIAAGNSSLQAEDIHPGPRLRMPDLCRRPGGQFFPLPADPDLQEPSGPGFALDSESGRIRCAVEYDPSSQADRPPKTGAARQRMIRPWRTP